MSRLFSAYVIVDWSAAAKPTTGADSIWIGVLKRDIRFRMAFESFNPATRAEAEVRLTAILDDLRKRALFERDAERLADCRRRVNRLPLGAAAVVERVMDHQQALVACHWAAVWIPRSRSRRSPRR